MRRRRVWLVVGAVVTAAIVLAACVFTPGRLVTTNDAGANPGTKSFGLFGSDARFTWSPNQVLDRQRNLVWARRASEPRRWADAASYCEELGMRVPLREELVEISEWFGTDLFPDTTPRTEWHWSTSPGARAGTAWAIGSAGYANANDVEAKSLVRCVSSP